MKKLLNTFQKHKAKAVSLMTLVYIIAFASVYVVMESDFINAQILNGPELDFSASQIEEFIIEELDENEIEELLGVVGSPTRGETEIDIDDLIQSEILFHPNGEILSWAMFYKFLAEKEGAQIHSQADEAWFTAYEKWFLSKYPNFEGNLPADPAAPITVQDLYEGLPPGVTSSFIHPSADDGLLKLLEGDVSLDELLEYFDEEDEEFGASDLALLAEQSYFPDIDDIDLEEEELSEEYLVEFLDSELENFVEFEDELASYDTSENPFSHSYEADEILNGQISDGLLEVIGEDRIAEMQKNEGVLEGPSISQLYSDLEVLWTEEELDEDYVDPLSEY